MHEQSQTRRNPFGDWYNSPGAKPRTRLRPKFNFEQDFYATPTGASNAAALRSRLTEDLHGVPPPTEAIPSFRQDPYSPIESFLRTAAPPTARERSGDFDPSLSMNPIVQMLIQSSREGRERPEPIQYEEDPAPIAPFQRPYSGQDAIKAMLMRRSVQR